MRSWVLVFVIGCGGGSGGPHDAAVDGSGDGSSRDARVEPCAHDAPFVVQAPVPGIGSTDDELAFRPTSDGLAAVVTRRGTNGIASLYLATRSDTTQPFGEPQRLPGPINDNDARYGQLAVDGLSIHFATTANVNSDIVVATRDDVSASFGMPAPIASITTTGDEREPYITDRGLYFTRNAHVFFAPTDAGGFGAPIELTTSNEVQGGSPVLTSDELEIFFAVGADNMSHSVRSSIAEMFPLATSVIALSMANTLAPAYVSPDHCDLYIETDIPGGSGGSDIWLATRR